MSRIEREWWSRAVCCGYACIFYYYYIDERVQDAIHKTKLKILFLLLLFKSTFLTFDFNKLKWSKCKHSKHSCIQLFYNHCSVDRRMRGIENHWNSFMTKMIMCVSFCVFHAQSADDLHLLCFVQIQHTKTNKSRTVTVFACDHFLLLYLVFRFSIPVVAYRTELRYWSAEYGHWPWHQFTENGQTWEIPSANSLLYIVLNGNGEIVIAIYQN